MATGTDPVDTPYINRLKNKCVVVDVAMVTFSVTRCLVSTCKDGVSGVSDLLLLPILPFFFFSL